MTVTIRADLDQAPGLCLLVLGTWPLWLQSSWQPHVLALRGDLSKGLKADM